MKIKFATWNVDSRRFNSDHMDILSSNSVDILALQEVRRGFCESLLSTQIFEWARFSLNIVSGQSQGCALFGKSPHKPGGWKVLKNAPIPEQTIVLRLRTPLGGLNVGSFHIPNGRNWGERKRETGRIIADWLKYRRNRTIFGIDSNGPAIDHPNINKRVLWKYDSPELLGMQPAHNLRDALRMYFNSHPRKARTILKQRPSAGPLAVTYNKGNYKTPVERRYDYIYISPDIEVEKIDHLNINEAASYHALVIAELNAL